MADLPITFEIGGRDYTENTASQDGSRPDYSVTKQMPTGSRMSIHLEIPISKDVPRPGELVFVRITDLDNNVINFFTGQLTELDYQDLTDREALDLQCQGLYYWLSRTFIPRYKSFNPVNFTTAIDAVLIMAKLKSGSYAINPFSIVTYGMFPEMITIETDENITAADAIQAICDLFGVDWYVGDSGATKIANISTTVTDLIFIKKDFDYTGPITTINNTDLSCPPIGMKDIRSVKVKLGLPTPSTVEVGTDVRSLEAKDQLDELLELKDLAFGSNSTQAVFDLPDEVNHIESATILTATQTRPLTVKQTEYDPTAVDPFGGNESAFQKKPPAFILKMSVKDFLDTPSETGFIRADYRIKRAYGKVSNTDLEGFLFDQEKWGDSDTPRSVQQIVAGEIQTQVDATALAQAALDAAPKEFLGLEFQTTEDVKLGQAIYYTNDRIPWISGNNRTVIRQIAEKTINTTNDLSLSLGSLIDKTVTCEVVKRSSPMEQIFLAAKQLIARDPGIGKTIGWPQGQSPCNMLGMLSNPTGDFEIVDDLYQLSTFNGVFTIDVNFNAINNERYRIIARTIASNTGSSSFTANLSVTDFPLFNQTIPIGPDESQEVVVMVKQLTLAQAQVMRTVSVQATDTVIDTGTPSYKLVDVRLVCDPECAYSPFDLLNFTDDMIDNEGQPTILTSGTSGSFDAQFYQTTPGDTINQNETYRFQFNVDTQTSDGNTATFTVDVFGSTVFSLEQSGNQTQRNRISISDLTLEQVQNITISATKVDSVGEGSVITFNVGDNAFVVSCVFVSPIRYTGSTGDVTIDEATLVDCNSNFIVPAATGTVLAQATSLPAEVTEVIVFVLGQLIVLVKPGNTVTATCSIETPSGTTSKNFTTNVARTENITASFSATRAEILAGVELTLSSSITVDPPTPTDEESLVSLHLNDIGFKIFLVY